MWDTIAFMHAAFCYHWKFFNFLWVHMPVQLCQSFDSSCNLLDHNPSLKEIKAPQLSYEFIYIQMFKIIDYGIAAWGFWKTLLLSGHSKISLVWSPLNQSETTTQSFVWSPMRYWKHILSKRNKSLSNYNLNPVICSIW